MSEPSPGSFLRAATITDTVNLGTVALRAGRRVLFDSERAEITNVPDANRLLTRDTAPVGSCKADSGGCFRRRGI